ncbi:protein FAM92B-like [Arapaima gigas]
MNPLIFREPKIRLMEAVVNQAETQLGQLCSLLAAYTRRTAKLRDKADLLVHQLGEFANTEDHELRTGMRILAEDLAMLQDYRQAQVERLETRVVNPLKAYGDIVKNKRADLKKFTADHNRDLKVLQKLDRTRMKNPSDRQSIAEANALIATTNVNRNIRQLEETFSNFQLQKLQDIKRIFMDFITIEMLFHAKALEVYSNTFQLLKDIDVDKDLETFRAKIQVHDDILDSHTMQASILMTSSGLSTVPRYPSPSSLRQPLDYPKQTTPISIRQSQRRLHRQEEVYEDDDEDDDDEEEEEEKELQQEEEEKTKESYAVRYTRMKRQKP